MSLLVLVFILGAVTGSFLNVCIYRMPNGQSVIRPRSHCVSCAKTIGWFDNIPLLSYIILSGKCRFCGARISLRYPLVEFLTGALFAFLYHIYGINIMFFYYSLFFALLIVATFVDISHQIIPDEISIGGTVAALLLNIILGIKSNPGGFDWQPLSRGLIGAAAGAAIIYSAGFIFDLVYFRILKKPPVEGETSSMGLGDVKLMAMVGAFLGWEKAVLTFFLAPFPGAAAGIWNLARKKSHVIPYGPFLALAAILSFLLGNRIISFILPNIS